MLLCLKYLDACGNDEYEHARWLEHLAKEQMLLNVWGELSRTLEHVRFPTGAEWARSDGSWTHVHAVPVMYEVESRWKTEEGVQGISNA
ncbi:hypothetical protein FRC10_001217 [Ceratobasidium sp. 414]|nr:hypothetical protein FRC10_001217 [Ceratobasidium sp. 414]